LEQLHAIHDARRIERLECRLIRENALEVGQSAGDFDE